MKFSYIMSVFTRLGLRPDSDIDLVKAPDRAPELHITPPNGRVIRLSQEAVEALVGLDELPGPALLKVAPIPNEELDRVTFDKVRKDDKTAYRAARGRVPPGLEAFEEWRPAFSASSRPIPELLPTLSEVVRKPEVPEAPEPLIHECGVLCGCIDDPLDKNMVPFSQASHQAQMSYLAAQVALNTPAYIQRALVSVPELKVNSWWRLQPNLRDDGGDDHVQVKRLGSTCVYFDIYETGMPGSTPYEDFFIRYMPTTAPAVDVRGG